MAESKSKKTIENFADELDSMLTVDDMTPQAALIDDDEALERLLVGNVEEPSEQAHDDLLEIDALIASVPDTGSPILPLDEFAEDLQSVIDAAVESESASMANQPEPPDLDIQADLDELAIDDELIAPENATSNDVLAGDGRYESAAFDISTDEESEALTRAAGGIETVSRDELALLSEFSANQTAIDETSLPEFTAGGRQEPRASGSPAPVSAVTVDHSQELAALTHQLKDLKKQNVQIKHALEQAIEQKADKESLSSCLDTLETLQTGQKKVARNLEAVSNRKPVAAWVASGIGVLALAIGVGMGFQGVVAKSQVGELLGMLQKLQEQTESAPAASAADQAMVQKQLDELAAANGAISQQLQTLGKQLEGEGGSAQLPSDVSKQLSDLGAQLMQMGATVEVIQSRVAALEKGRPVASGSGASKQAPTPKKVVTEESWSVNLVAFKQDWYAQRKAQEFADKGVTANVVRSESKGETWYRLAVDGFKSQYEAAAYAARIKKTLNLDSVWVSKN